jgi:hypothetical protein
MRATAAVAALFAVGLLLSACGSSKAGAGSGATTSTAGGTSPSGGGTSSTSTTSDAPQTTTTFYSKGKIVERSPTASAPRQSSGFPVSKDLQSGDQILIYPGAFWPNQLTANQLVPVTWTNMTKVTQTVTIIGIGVTSPPIPPGSQWVWKSTGGGVLAYKSASGFQAILNLQYPTPVTLPPSS